MNRSRDKAKRICYHIEVIPQSIQRFLFQDFEGIRNTSVYITIEGI